MKNNQEGKKGRSEGDKQKKNDKWDKEDRIWKYDRDRYKKESRRILNQLQED